MAINDDTLKGVTTPISAYAAVALLHSETLISRSGRVLSMIRLILAVGVVLWVCFAIIGGISR